MPFSFKGIEVSSNPRTEKIQTDPKTEVSANSTIKYCWEFWILEHNFKIFEIKLILFR
jgi:hypothetical protein